MTVHCTSLYSINKLLGKGNSPSLSTGATDGDIGIQDYLSIGNPE